MAPTEQEVRQALMQTGHMLPMNEAAIAALDSTDPVSAVSLPPALSAERLLDRIHGKATPPNVLKALPKPQAAPEWLARAARNGDELPDDVVARMEADRERIEDQQ